MIEVDQLLDRCLVAWRSICADESERERFDAAVALFSRDELRNLMMENTAAVMREHVARPVGGLVQTLN